MSQLLREERAVLFTMKVLRTAKDWQEGQHALADHSVFEYRLEGVSSE